MSSEEKEQSIQDVINTIKEVSATSDKKLDRFDYNKEQNKDAPTFFSKEDITQAAKSVVNSQSEIAKQIQGLNPSIIRSPEELKLEMMEVFKRQEEHRESRQLHELWRDRIPVLPPNPELEAQRENTKAIKELDKKLDRFILNDSSLKSVDAPIKDSEVKEVDVSDEKAILTLFKPRPSDIPSGDIKLIEKYLASLTKDEKVLFIDKAILPEWRGKSKHVWSATYVADKYFGISARTFGRWRNESGLPRKW